MGENINIHYILVFYVVEKIDMFIIGNGSAKKNKLFFLNRVTPNPMLHAGFRTLLNKKDTD